MFIRRILTTAFLVALAVAGTMVWLPGCSSNPSAPVFNNIFDPDGPAGGNPLQLTATLSDSSILLSWTQPQDFNISSYELSHSYNYFSDFLPFGSVDQTEATFGTLRYENAEPTATHYFKIQAFDAEGNFTNITDQAPTIRTTPPLVAVGDGSGTVASRNITLAILVSAGDSLRISNDRDFAPETRVAVGEPGITLEVPWTLPEVAANDTTLAVRVLAFPLAGAADTAVVNLNVNFAPAFTVLGNEPTVAARHLILEVPDQGVVFMRFSDSEAGLADQPWSPGRPVFPYTLADSANPQVVWGEFMGDFGFASIVSLTVTPDLLQEVTFALDLPADHVTDQSTVTVFSGAVASLMRFSESIDFAGVPWQAYADTSALALSPEPGQKVIYAQYRNDWAESPVMTDFVIYLSQPLEVAILAPTDGASVASGVPLQVLGTATAASGTAPVDSVKFDSGDGTGFQTVTGTDNWSFLWDVPLVTQETTSTLRARAWAAGDSVTSIATVTLLPEVQP